MVYVSVQNMEMLYFLSLVDLRNPRVHLFWELNQSSLLLELHLIQLLTMLENYFLAEGKKDGSFD